jgi:hypothetical protein
MSESKIESFHSHETFKANEIEHKEEANKLFELINNLNDPFGNEINLSKPFNI